MVFYTPLVHRKIAAFASGCESLAASRWLMPVDGSRPAFLRACKLMTRSLHRAGPFVIGIPEVGWVGVFGMMDFAICLRQRKWPGEWEVD